MYWGYNTDDWFGNYDENLLKNRIFPRSYENKSIKDLIEIYKFNLYNGLGHGIDDALAHSKHINKKYSKERYDIFINVPCFYKEKQIKNTIEEIKKQINQNPTKNFLLLIYNNGYFYGENTLFDIKILEKDIANLLDEYKIKNLDYIIISRMYNRKEYMSRIRSDIFNSLILSDISNKVDENTIYLSFDADIRKIEDGYIKKVVEQHNNGYKIVIGNRNWSFEEEKEKDLLLYLQEQIFLLGEEFIYNMSDDINISTITNGWSSSFNLKSLLLVKGYEKDFKTIDDIIIGHKLNRFYGGETKNKKITSFINKKIRSDGSRGSETLQKGKLLFEQRDPDFYEVKENRESKKEFYEKKNYILNSLVKGKLIKERDIARLKSVLNSYISHFYGKNEHLNSIFCKDLIKLLKEFFGKLCLYKFDYIKEENKINITTIL